MNDAIKTYQEAFEILKPVLRVVFLILIFLFCFSTFFRIIRIICIEPLSLLDFLSDLKECIFYREKFTCRMDAEKCAVFEDESEIDIGEFKCSEHCEHYGKCVNCMFFDYEEDKYICGKCHHRQERRKLKPLEDVEK